LLHDLTLELNMQKSIPPKINLLRMLTRIIIVLSSIITLPSLLSSFATILAIVYLIGSIKRNPEIGESTPLFLVGFFLLLPAQFLGWWLYRIYWKDYLKPDPTRKVSWLVSCLYNLILLLFFIEMAKDPFENIFNAEFELLPEFLVVFSAVMAALSLWIWLLKIFKQSVNS
jgi:hypothetical protein